MKICKLDGCNNELGKYCGKREYCCDAHKQKAYRNRQDEKLVNKEGTKESRTDNSNVHGEAQPQS